MEQSKLSRILIPAALLAFLLTVGTFAYRQLREQNEPETAPLPEPSAENAGAAPDFSVQDADASPVHLSDFRGRPVLINFWATWCPPCRSELPYFEEAYRTYSDRLDVMMVDLTDGRQETREIVQDFLTENGYTFPVYYDTQGSASQAYGLYSIPQTVCVDAEGNLLASHIGAMTAEELSEYIALLLPGEEDATWNSTTSQE
ncbi:MAG: TlpA family protein disulfide reductase [Oscillospiraceae bacterium]|nr:TlpA family protein disulfide reductase [Oscillospiraceae bacterium]